MSSADPYIAEITFLDGTTRKFRYRLFRDLQWGFEFHSERAGCPVLHVPFTRMQTVETRTATDDD